MHTHMYVHVCATAYKPRSTKTLPNTCRLRQSDNEHSDLSGQLM